MKSFRYFSRRGHGSHRLSALTHLGATLVLPVLLLMLAGAAVTGAYSVPEAYRTLGVMLFTALLASLARLFGAYVLSLLVGIPLGLLAERSRRLESVLLPVYDVLESMPVLAFFPVVILFFIRADLAEGAAIFIIFFSMVWNISFSVIGGMKQIPSDVRAVGAVFGLSRLRQLTTIILPALVPPLLTGSILALADGWNIVIVAEALHVYAPQSTGAHDLYGIGSILVNAATASNTPLLLSAMGVLVLAIALINVFVWQPLLALAERFKFE